MRIDFQMLARYCLAQVFACRKLEHRIKGNCLKCRTIGISCDCIHSAIDDTTLLLDMIETGDEEKVSAIGFLIREVAWFNGQAVKSRQVMSDNRLFNVFQALQRFAQP